MTNLVVLCGLATNPAAPLPVLLRLAAHAHSGFLAPSLALLDRDHLPPEVAAALADHPDTEVRRRLAAHPATPDEVRQALAGDTEPVVRAEVAATPLPVEVYRGLAADPESSVRAAVGGNRHVPAAVRATLAVDTDPEVRRRTAMRSLPPAVLHTLIGDLDLAVRRAALLAAAVHAPLATIPEDLAELFHQDPAWYRQAVELVELTPPLLTRLSASPDLRRALARNPSLPTEHMRAFLADADLRTALAGNPSLPADLLEELAATDDPEVHRGLLPRLQLPDRLRRRLVAASENDDPLPLVTSLLPEHAGLEVRLSYVDHPNPAFRRTLAFSPDLPSDAVQRLAEDPDFQTRVLVCERHLNIPGATLVDVLERWRGTAARTCSAIPACRPRPCPATSPATAPATGKRSRPVRTCRPNWSTRS
ncbi:hypothetical protein GCM10029964_041410 [Kibdelosporangium lantanae]